MKRIYMAAMAAALALVVAGCSSATTQARFVGYKWRVTSITSQGKQTPIPLSGNQYSQVYVLFTPNGQFAANDPVNIHEGTYRQVGDGFTTSSLIVSAVGYAGGNQTTMLAIDAISAFNETRATATVTGDQMVISVGGFLLGCQRDGPSGASFF